MPVHIKPVTEIADFERIAALEARIWGGTPRLNTLLVSIGRAQGVVLLAEVGETAVGFCYSFPSFDVLASGEKQLKHYSYILGIHPAYRNQQIGYQLKQAQRTAVLAQGIGKMVWTFDPLETRNAYLNLHKLGAVCRTYYQNFYGLLEDPLNKGIFTDRFLVTWWLDRPRPRLAIAQPSVTLPPEPTQPLPDFAQTPRLILAAVPTHWQAIKQADLPLAQAWRGYTRQLFTAAFAAGYTAVGLQRGDPYCYYVLQKDWTLPDEN